MSMSVLNQSSCWYFLYNVIAQEAVTPDLLI
jgi:hypothetical protein